HTYKIRLLKCRNHVARSFLQKSTKKHQTNQQQEQRRHQRRRRKQPRINEEKQPDHANLPRFIQLVVGRSELCYFGFSNLSAEHDIICKTHFSPPNQRQARRRQTHEPYAYEKASLQCNCVHCYHFLSPGVPRLPITPPPQPNIFEITPIGTRGRCTGKGPPASAAAARTRNLPLVRHHTPSDIP
ncbi:unnamed protein product, partial [Ectocarpus sp. 13 AM-2016]